MCENAIRSFCSFFKFHRLVQSIYWLRECVRLFRVCVMRLCVNAKARRKIGGYNYILRHYLLLQAFPEPSLEILVLILLASNLSQPNS